MSKILFMHGLDSSKDSTKFHALNATQKYCIDIDYRNLNYDTVAELYQDIIQKIQPKLIVGHSLGGYWALKMSQVFRIPAIVANPSLHPDFRADYAPITEYDLEHDIPQTAYIELGDEILDMYETSNILEPYMYVEMMQGGHHRLASPENLNHMIKYMQDTFVI
ncbi:YqiA/YcfP family alpha/beta fold hydrolase [Acinetobacter defluvii]|nr:YqiA/YcfP family alpha/beta fold hydrolase [Acinetobacter defluvii]